MPIASAISGMVMPGRLAHELERLLAARAAAARAPAAAGAAAGRRGAVAPCRGGGRCAVAGARWRGRAPTPSSAAAAASRRWYSSTSGRSSFSRASISRFLLFQEVSHVRLPVRQ